MEIREYIDINGINTYKKWFNSLEPIAAAKVTVAKAHLELGNTSSVKWFSGIGEYRINFGPGYRIYLSQEGEELILLYAGGTKKKQQKDIEKAKKLHKEYKQRKKDTTSQ